MNTGAKTERSANGRSDENDQTAPDVGAVELRAYASKKFQWLEAISIDPGASSHDFEVAFAISRVISAKSWRGVIADDTIAEATQTSRRHVYASRIKLRELGWLSWLRTRTANIYRLKFTHLNKMTDYRALLRDQRAEARTKRWHSSQGAAPKSARHKDTSGVKSSSHPKISDVKPSSHHNTSDAHRGSQHDAHHSSQHDVNWSSHIPPIDNPLNVPPIDGLSTGRTDLEFIDGPTDVEPPLPAAAIDRERPFPAVENPRFAELELLDLLGDDDRGVQVADLISDDTYRKLLDRLVLGRLVTSDLDSARQEAREAARGEP